MKLVQMHCSVFGDFLEWQSPDGMIHPQIPITHEDIATQKIYTLDEDAMHEAFSAMMDRIYGGGEDV